MGQSFRNAYERSKFEAELMLREEGAHLPLQVLRPSIVVGDSRTGRTSSFNVLYGRSRRSRAARSRRSRRAARRRWTSCRSTTWPTACTTWPATVRTEPSTLVAGRNATSVGRLLDLGRRAWSSAAGGASARPLPAPPPPAATPAPAGPPRMEVYFPYFSMRVRFDDRELGPAPPVESYFGRLIEFAEQARWGRRPALLASPPPGRRLNRRWRRLDPGLAYGERGPRKDSRGGVRSVQPSGDRRGWGSTRSWPRRASRR